jgi:hypothetical protein
MKNGYRLCLECLSDWTYSVDPLCPSCKIYHELRDAVRPDWTGDPDTHGWWGATLHDDGNDRVIDPEDIKDGFIIEPQSQWVKD